MNKRLVLILGIILSISFFLIGLWQLEIIFIVMSYDIFSFNFAGFGNFGLPNFIWRDIFYIWQTVALIVLGICCFLLGVEKGEGWL